MTWIVKHVQSKNEPTCTCCRVAFVLVVQNFLGNKWAENNGELLDNMFTAYEKLGCRMSLKCIFCIHISIFFPTNLGSVSNEHGERFHQYISVIERSYKGTFWEFTTGLCNRTWQPDNPIQTPKQVLTAFLNSKGMNGTVVSFTTVGIIMNTKT